MIANLQYNSHSKSLVFNFNLFEVKIFQDLIVLMSNRHLVCYFIFPLYEVDQLSSLPILSFFVIVIRN